MFANIKLYTLFFYDKQDLCDIIYHDKVCIIIKILYMMASINLISMTNKALILSIIMLKD